MGGSGSGRWGAARMKKACVEDFLCLDVNQLHREHVFRTAGEILWTWSSNSRSAKPLASIRLWTVRGGLRLAYSSTTKQDEPPRELCYSIPMEWTPCHLGNERPWFLCPGPDCGYQRVARLYLRNSYFLCRRCHNLTYASQQKGEEDRMLQRLVKLRCRIGGIAYAAPLAKHFPLKPPRMHWSTYERLREQGDALEEAVLADTERRVQLAMKRLGLPDD